jgi:hypothetical protein
VDVLGSVTYCCTIMGDINCEEWKEFITNENYDHY